MSSLPQELVDLIISFLDHNDLKETLFVSRAFQRATERASGAFTSFAFKKHDLDERRVFVTKFASHRFRFLRQIEVFTKFPPIDETIRTPCRESVKQLHEKDEAFTEQIKHAWATMRHVESAQNYGVGKMQIRVYAPTRIVEGDVCDHKRYSRWRIHLLDPEQLPQLKSVCALTVCDLADKDLEDNAYRYKLDLRAVLDLAARCPSLEYLGCKFGVDDWVSTADPWMEHFMHDFPGCRRDTRNDFAIAGRHIGLPASLKHVQLDFINAIFDSVEEQCRPSPNLVYPHLFDSFSSSLRLLSSQLRRLDLHVMADDTLFWPRNDSIKMPKLLEAWLWTPLSYHPHDMPEQEDADISALYPEGDFGWGLMYSAPGGPISGGGCTATRELKWRVGPWRPASELRKLFSKIGQEQYGDQLDETWHDEKGDDGWVSREWFWGATICPEGADPNTYPTYFS